MPIEKPSDLELQVLSVLWDEGPMTARAMLQRLPDGKDRAYTTVLSILQVMEKKGLVTHQTEGRANVYRAKVSRKLVMKPFVRTLVRNVFGGSPARVLQQLLDDGPMDPDELAEIRALIEAHERGESRSSK